MAEVFQQGIGALINTRGNIAHGGRPNIQLKKLRDWLKMVKKYGVVLEKIVANHLSRSQKS
jgi:hypothetical protein